MNKHFDSALRHKNSDLTEKLHEHHRGISGHTKLYCLLGNPVAHSLSPAMYNYSFLNHGIDACYTAFKVSEEDMPKALSAVCALGIKGGNVTMPGKTAAAKLCHELSDAAEIIGACNTFVNEGGRLIGHMTDGLGFTDSLRLRGYAPEQKRIVLLGAGGAATAILVQCALEQAAQIHVFNRRSPRFIAIGQVIERLKDHQPSVDIHLFDWTDVQQLQRSIAAADLLINATNIGMAPHIDQLPLPDVNCLRDDLAVADIIYNPEETKLMKCAREKGAPLVIGGHGMLLYQGRAAYKIFTGLEMPVKDVGREIFGIEILE
ncbi:MAG: shikimate dehydrogenase [Fastidiosipilaceae bacterium]|jgi:quinate/shikimate dehydrogenase|nr:shikimate dehydrogenase [Clostridiaceae bacterium]